MPAQNFRATAPTVKTYRIATSGPTVDGREILPAWLQQAAAHYDPDLYAARINCEHLRGFSTDGPFGAFGDVVALRAETNKQGRVELYADLVPNDRAIAANKAGQKVYPSIEIVENFAGRGHAYMVGMALTDTPASLGTQRLTFSAQQVNDDATYTAAPITKWATDDAHAFGLARPIELDLAATEDGDAQPDTGALRQAFAALREKFAATFRGQNAATTTLVAEVAATLDAFGTTTADQLAAAQTRADQIAADQAALQAAHDQLAKDFAALQTQLAAQPASGQRKLSTGGANAEHLAQF